MDAGNALVLEGGGFRSMFTAGVLDVLQEHGIYGFDSVWGVSAGAISAASYKSRQIGRTMRIMLAFRDNRRFMSLWSFAVTGNVAGAEFMYDEVQNRLDPSRDDVFNANDLRMYAVATDVERGMAAYLPCEHLPEDIDKIRASSSLPPLSQMVEIDGRLYLDGGTTDSIPFEVALGLEGAPAVEGHVPAKRALVVLTQDRVYKKNSRNEMIAVRSRRYDDYPAYVKTLESRAGKYNACRERLFALEAAPESPVLVIAPERPVDIGVGDRDGGKLLSLYLQGRQQAERRLEEIRSFVG